jgi:signal transduction histidine kinase
MLSKNLFIRITAPTVLVSLLLLGLSLATGVYLSHLQTERSARWREDFISHRIADQLEVTLRLLAQLLHDNSIRVQRLHEHIDILLDKASAFADHEEEKQLVAQMKVSYAEYLHCWQPFAREDRAASPEVTRSALAILETRVIPVCESLRKYNNEQSELSEAAHQRTVGWLVWGIIGVGSLGAVAGVLMGYWVARGLRRSIYHLSVRVQDAANKLGQDIPSVALAEDADLQQIHEQLQEVVHEIEQVVARLQQREREVLRAEQLSAVGQLAAGVAHELRNPLTSIKMLIQVIHEEMAAHGGAAEDLGVIELEIRRMERTLQTFLDFARPPKPEFRPLNLAEAVQRTLALISGRARKQKVDLVFTPPEPPVYVQADAEQMQQLLVNLTLNALDVMPRGGILEISLERTTGGQVVLRVRDTGPGIASELMPRLFQPFVSSKETGLGLGLVTSQRVAETHGGTIQATNFASGGACFLVSLPVLPAPSLVRA